MDDYTCACGFGAASVEELGDHVGEMAIPPDDIAPDGRVHAEAARDAASPAGCRCVCGFRSDSMSGVDEHLLGVFTETGRDRPGRPQARASWSVAPKSSSPPRGTGVRGQQRPHFGVGPQILFHVQRPEHAVQGEARTLRDTRRRLVVHAYEQL